MNASSAASLSITTMKTALLRPYLTLLLLLLLSALLTPVVLGHGGDEHGDETAATVVATAGAPRATLQGEFAEAVLIANEQNLTLWLDDSDSNAPLNAELQLQIGDRSIALVRSGEGQYQAELAAALEHGSHALVLTVITDTGADLLAGELLVPEHDESEHDGTGSDGHSGWWALLVLPVLVAAFWIYGRRQRAVVATVVIASSFALLLPMLTAATAQAGGDHSDGHSHDEPAEATTEIAGDTPRRLPDGSLFVPKSAQRLLNVRTERVGIGEHAMSLRLNGQVIADPNGSGLVQATQTGRVLPAGKRLPTLGSTVKAGDTLALLEPILNQSERATMTGELARVEASLSAAEKRLSRLSSIRDSVPRRELDQAEVDVAGLRAQRAALNESLHAKLPLRAPISGVISDATVIAGAQVEAGSTVFEIISNEALAVEAGAYDDRYLRSVQNAVFVHNSKEYPLKLIGVGRKLRDQAVPVQFQVIGNARELATGAIGTVLAQSSDKQRGASVPQSALLRGDDGRPTVLIKIAPEQFKLVAVSHEPLPDNRALISSGLQDGERIVISGASLLQQIR